jgi:2-amino-4-hydroxy-6-hydroxymethyldihydropteridine diphosphokinase
LDASQNRVYLGLGSNIGDRIKNLESAIKRLEKNPLVAIGNASSFYETEPVGYKGQGWFVNQAVEIETAIAPLGLLRALQGIEKEMGRERRERWGPRIIDIDILFYGNLILAITELTIPHPHIHERRFVLVPLAEIAPSFMHPVFNKSIERLLIDTPDTNQVKKIGMGL